MKCSVRIPSDFFPYPGDPIASNMEAGIKVEVEMAIKSQPLYARYPAWYFFAVIWWHDELGYWAGEVWVERKYVCSYIAERIEDLVNEIDAAHGNGEKPIFLSQEK